MIEECRIKYAAPLRLMVSFKPGKVSQVASIELDIALLDGDEKFLATAKKIEGWSENTLEWLKGFCNSVEEDVEIDLDETKQVDKPVKAESSIQGLRFGEE